MEIKSIQTNNPSTAIPASAQQPRTVLVFVIGLISLSVIIFAYLAYTYLHKTGRLAVPETLTAEQKKVITEQLNAYAAENPLPEDRRTQMITGKPSAAAKPAATPKK